MKKKYRTKTVLTAWIFILPFFVLFTIFVIYPIIQGVWVSLNDWSLMGRTGFVGVANYGKMFRDKNFWAAFRNTCIFVVFSVPFIVLLGLAMALLANRKVRMRKFLRIAYYVPGVLSVSVASFVAKYSFAPYRGLVNGILKSMGLMSTSNEILWFEDTKLAWCAIVLMTVWWTVGFPMLLYLSALQDISPDVLEAAKVDGAGSAQCLFQITLPLIKNTIFLVILLEVMASFKVFGQIYNITKGGPANTTRPLVMYVYQQAFDKNKLGYAASISYFLFAIIVICTVIQLKLQKEGD
ncbi:MAG: sugar ABC transporter permease [Lachnospiraceae bacterium]|jgi:multiple sugar transport system permease protein|nr:sugar ABC transporter permease [Lachnospiraceae bacterium]